MRVNTHNGKGKIVESVEIPDPEPDPPTDVERLAAVLVEKVDALTEADVALALGVEQERVSAAAQEMKGEQA